VKLTRTVARIEIRSDRRLPENRTKVIASTNDLARDGHVVEPTGLQTTNFLRTGTILFDHDSSTPVGKPVAAVPSADGKRLEVEIEWAPEGISEAADRCRGLVKAGIIRAVSIGFMPTELEPLDPKDPWGGQHIKEADLLELSFVGVPADTGAVVTQRAARPSLSRAQRMAELAQILNRIEDPAAAITQRNRAPSLSPQQQFEADRLRCTAAFTRVQAADERRSQRRRELAELLAKT